MLTKNFAPCFLSFEIVDANTAKILSLWGTVENLAHATTAREKQLFEFFYLLNGGENFFNVAIFLTTENGTLSDYAEIDAAPREYSELYPATLPDNWDFDGWKTTLDNVLSPESSEVFYTGLDNYFQTMFQGETIFTRCSTNYAQLPADSFLTDGDGFLQIIQQNGNTCFVFDGKDTFAIANDLLSPVTAEQLPKKIAAEIAKYRAKYDERNEEDRITYETWLQKTADRAAKKAEKEAGGKVAKMQKLFAAYVPDHKAPETDNPAEWAMFFELLSMTAPEGFGELAFSDRIKTAEKMAKEAKAVKVAETANNESQRLLKEFFTLSKTATLDELKAWMLENQKGMIGKADENGNSDRKQATDLYRTLKTDAEVVAKAAEKAAKEAEKAAEKAEASVQEVEVTSLPTTMSRKAAKQPKAEKVEEVEVEETV